MAEQKGAPAPPPPYPGPAMSAPQAYQPQPTQSGTAYPPGAYPAGYPAYQGYPAYGYQYYPPPPGAMYGATQAHTVYVMEDQRRGGSALGDCLTGCLTALCCCCMWDMLTNVPTS